LAAALGGAATAQTTDTSAAPASSPQHARGAIIQASRDYIPDAAIRANQNGETSIDCSVLENGRLSACTVESESPENWGFGAAAIRMASNFRMAARTSDGRSTAGGHVRLNIVFNPATARAHFR